MFMVKYDLLIRVIITDAVKKIKVFHKFPINFLRFKK